MNVITRKSIRAVLAVAGLGLFVATSLSASPFNKTTYFTFSGSVALPGVVLPAGEYVFEVVDTSSRNVVRVTNRQRSRLYLQALTLRKERPVGMNAATITFGEAPAGQPKPIVAWYPIAETTGYQFIY